MKFILFFFCINALMFQARAQGEKSLVGAWIDVDTRTVYVFFPDGTMLFTFLDPPQGPAKTIAAVEFWHNIGTWEMLKNGKVKTTYKIPSKASEPFAPDILEMKFVDEELISPHGEIYTRVDGSTPFPTKEKGHK